MASLSNNTEAIFIGKSMILWADGSVGVFIARYMLKNCDWKKQACKALAFLKETLRETCPTGQAAYRQYG